MATDGGAASSPAGKKANLLDPYSIKHLLDETVSEVVKSKGYAEDTRLSNRKLAVGAAVIAVALLAQFYPGKFPENRDVLLICIALYVVLNVVLRIVSYTKEKNAILFMYPPTGSFNRTGLVISSKLPRLSDMFTTAFPFALLLVEGLFWKDIEKLIDDYSSDHRSK